MNSASRLIIFTCTLLTACSQAPQDASLQGPQNALLQGPQAEARITSARLPIGNINASILPATNPINEIKHYSDTLLVINSNRLFQHSDMPLSTINYQKYASRLVKDIIQRIKAYPDTTHIDIKVYRYGVFPSTYLQQLSTQQAQTVAALLWDYGNIARERISYTGMGNQAPKISTTDSFTARSQNNRIEITIRKGA